MITIIVLMLLLALFCVVIIQQVQIDKIKTGDYLLWYSYKDKRYCINISEKCRNIFLN